LIALPNPQFDYYKLVLVSPSTRSVLVEEAQRTLRLPQIAIPRWTRTAEQINAVIEERWGFKVFVIDFLGDDPGPGNIVIAKVMNQGRAHDCRRGHRWAALDEVAEQEIGDPERSTVRSLLISGNTSRGPFSRLGWIEEVLDWIGSAAAIERSELTGGIEQFNASSASALIRVNRQDAPALWFKAAGEANALEGRITSNLAELFPEYLPRIVACHDDWNAWLMEDAGRSLDEGASIRLPLLEHVTLRLAELQKASVQHFDTLLSSGCCDQRLSVLRRGVPEILPYLDEAMAMQSLNTVPRIGPARLREVGKVLENACLRLEAMDIPNALIHPDINLGNILVGDGGCVFTDWANACVGNPFVTFEQLRVQLAQERSTQAWVPRLTQIYQEAWQTVLPSCQIECAFTLVPLISVASYLYSRKDWLTSEHRGDPQLQSYARSAARQMERAAQAIELKQALCA
jgi:Phosphotransferase enzyme family